MISFFGWRWTLDVVLSYYPCPRVSTSEHIETSDYWQSNSILGRWQDNRPWAITQSYIGFWLWEVLVTKNHFVSNWREQCMICPLHSLVNTILKIDSLSQTICNKWNMWWTNLSSFVLLTCQLLIQSHRSNVGKDQSVGIEKHTRSLSKSLRVQKIKYIQAEEQNWWKIKDQCFVHLCNSH